MSQKRGTPKASFLRQNGLFHFLSVQGDGRKKFKSIFALDFFDMNILPPGKQLDEFSVSLEFHSELPSIFASFVLNKMEWNFLSSE